MKLRKKLEDKKEVETPKLKLLPPNMKCPKCYKIFHLEQMKQ